MTIAARVFLESTLSPSSTFIPLNPQSNLELLEGSSFEEDIDHITRCFDKTTKPRFRDIEEPQYVKFGSTRDNDADVNIRFGQLKLTGYGLVFMADFGIVKHSDEDT